MHLIAQLKCNSNWCGGPAATAAEIQELVETLSVPIPSELVAFLNNFNGGHGGLGEGRCKLRIMSVKEMIKFQNVWNVDQEIPGALLFGSNFGDFGLLFDTTRMNAAGDCPVIMCPLSSLSVADSEPVSDSLAGLFYRSSIV